MQVDAPMSDTDRWVLEDHVLLTVEMFSSDVQECSKQILRIPVWHPQFEPAVVEILLSQMLQLPRPRLVPLFYYRLLEACAEKQTSLTKLIGEAFQAIFKKIPDMDEDCLDVLADTFAFRSSTKFLQEDWSFFVGPDIPDEVKRFARRTLQRLQRVMEHHNMMHRLPEALHVLAPLEPLPASGLAVVSKPQFGRLINLIRLKDSNPAKVLEYCRWLMLSTTQEADDEPTRSEAPPPGDGVPREGCDPPPPKRQKIDSKQEEFGQPPAQAWHLQDVAELVFSVMLQHGHKTPTHMSKILDGHEEVLSQLRLQAASEADSFEQTLTRCAFEFWRSSGQRLELTMDTLLHRQVLAPPNVVKVALSSKDCDSLQVWNICHNAAKKSLERMQSAREDLALAKKLVQEESLAKRQADLDSALQEIALLFTSMFTALVKNFMEAPQDSAHQTLMLRRIACMGRRYLSNIKPIVATAATTIPGVAENPEIAKVFAILNIM